MKIAYAGFDMLFPLLSSLHDNGCEVVKIFSNKVDNVTEYNCAVTDFAKKHNIPITFDKITLNDLKELKNNGVDALFCAAYYYRVPILENFKMINLHPSVLPVGRGAWPTAYAILNGITQSGVTFHKMEDGFDEGDILLKKSVDIAENETHKSLMKKLHALIPDITKELLSHFDYYYDNATPQTEGEYWDCPDEYDYIIEKDTDFDTASRILRAFSGFYTIYNDGEKEHRLLGAKAIKGENCDKQFKIKEGYLEVDSKG